MNVIEHLLVCLGEEGGEVAKECCKSLRFGLNDTNFLKPDGPNNVERLCDELNDFIAVIEMCVAFGIIPRDWQNLKKQVDKKLKVMDCMKYAQKVGALEKES